jgi:hypothetical protein
MEMYPSIFTIASGLTLYGYSSEILETVKGAWEQSVDINDALLHLHIKLGRTAKEIRI